jgi:hypothetical protein
MSMFVTFTKQLTKYLRSEPSSGIQPIPMDCYLDVVGGLVPFRFEEGRPKAVRDKVAGKGQQQYY